MEQCIKQHIREIIQKNARRKTSFGDNDVLLLQGISPIEYCGALLELKHYYNININDADIMGRKLETVNGICDFIVHQAKAEKPNSDLDTKYSNNSEGGT